MLSKKAGELFELAEKGKKYSDLGHLDLHGSDLKNLFRRTPYGTNAMGVIISPQSDLSETILTGANLAYSKLEYVNFSKADLSNANFEQSNLTGADLSDTILDGTNFEGAILTDTIFTRANFEGVEGLDIEQIKKQQRIKERVTLTWMASDKAPTNLLKSIPEDVSRYTGEVYLGGRKSRRKHKRSKKSRRNRK